MEDLILGIGRFGIVGGFGVCMVIVGKIVFLFWDI